MILYTWAPSLAAFRVRIALNLKGIEPEFRYVHLRRNGGEQFAPAYGAVNPMQEVPALVDGDRTISQSLAILEYLEETRPDPPLLPRDPYLRAKVREVGEIVNSGIHPFGTPKVFDYLKRELSLSEPQRKAWYPHWMAAGLSRLEKVVAPLAGHFCIGDEATTADCCWVPQFYYALRQGVEVSGCPTLGRLYESLRVRPAFARAMPEEQADFGQ